MKKFISKVKNFMFRPFSDSKIRMKCILICLISYVAFNSLALIFLSNYFWLGFISLAILALLLYVCKIPYNGGSDREN